MFKRYWAVYGTNAGEALRVSGTGAIIRSLKETSCDETLDVSLITLEEGKYCFNLGNSEKRRNAFMLIAGDSFDDWPDTYQEAGQEVQIEPGVKLNDAMREEVTAMTQANPLYGKTIAFEGDSICYGAGSTGGYAKTISERNAMVCYNTAVSGGVMPSGVLTSSGS